MEKDIQLMNFYFAYRQGLEWRYREYVRQINITVFIDSNEEIKAEFFSPDTKQFLAKPITEIYFLNQSLDQWLTFIQKEL